MKFSFAAIFALLFFVAVECFFVPEDWLIKNGYTVRKQQPPQEKAPLLSSPPPGKNSRRFHVRKGFRMIQKIDIGTGIIVLNDTLNNNDTIPVGPFTNDFIQWLETTGYADYNFPSLHLGINASYGGKEFPEQALNHTPIIFIHGNSDGALDDGTEYSSGFSSSIKYFLSMGYTSAELYAVTWGDRKLDKSYSRLHTCESMRRLRIFIEAVMKYTQSAKIDIIAHSMGVTLARQVIKGGRVMDLVEKCDLGHRLAVGTFVGIAAANYGLCICNYNTSLVLPVCAWKLGFYSGSGCQDIDPCTTPESNISCSTATPDDECEPIMSYTLMHLAGRTPEIYGPLVKDGEKVFSFWSEEDEIIGSNNVWGRKTSLMPFSDGFKVFPNMKHHQLKSDTVADQYKVIVEGTI